MENPWKFHGRWGWRNSQSASLQVNYMQVWLVLFNFTILKNQIERRYHCLDGYARALSLSVCLFFPMDVFFSMFFFPNVWINMHMWLVCLFFPGSFTKFTFSWDKEGSHNVEKVVNWIISEKYLLNKDALRWQRSSMILVQNSSRPKSTQAGALHGHPLRKQTKYINLKILRTVKST